MSNEFVRVELERESRRSLRELAEQDGCAQRACGFACGNFWPNRSLPLFISGRTSVAWQGDDELGEFAEPGFDVDPAAMLLDDDVVGDGETEPCPFSGW